MREIKFKFWCKGTSDNANFNKPGWWSYPNFLLDKYHDNLDIFKSPHFMACQYTGLKDKNETEIYDGDIVKYTLSNSEFIDHVAWENYGWVLMGGDFNGSYPITGGYNMEIIGNIYENPELLG